MGETISSPTVSIKAEIGNLVVDVLEERDVAIFDVKGAYLQATMPEEKIVILKLRKKLLT